MRPFTSCLFSWCARGNKDAPSVDFVGLQLVRKGPQVLPGYSIPHNVVPPLYRKQIEHTKLLF
jgi:hypothetical protein